MGYDLKKKEISGFKFLVSIRFHLQFMQLFLQFLVDIGSAISYRNSSNFINEEDGGAVWTGGKGGRLRAFWLQQQMIIQIQFILVWVFVLENLYNRKESTILFVLFRIQLNLVHFFILSTH
ncbi:hypothetical protein P3X46_028007 [Hevea brasiliensis]|uniref:Transmembrane protein n=1 Tax=Hevea brasiliensis TaxID=3981 RepID=A0ABQ9KNW7_HEVBR|nr:hypothetical protein P3X46_028007 [Hevea brasiliensis]